MIIEINDTYNFYKLTAVDGMVITKWTEDEDITTYSSSTLIYCPLSTEIEVYREITLEEDARLKAAQEDAIAAEQVIDFE